MAKDSPRTTAGELQKIVESGGKKTFKFFFKKHLHYHMLFGRVFSPSSSKFLIQYSPSSSKNKLQHVQSSDTTGTSNGTGFYGQMKQKK